MDRSDYKGSFTLGRFVHTEMDRSHWTGVFFLTLILIAYSEIEIDHSFSYILLLLNGSQY